MGGSILWKRRGVLVGSLWRIGSWRGIYEPIRHKVAYSMTRGGTEGREWSGGDPLAMPKQHILEEDKCFDSWEVKIKGRMRTTGYMSQVRFLGCSDQFGLLGRLRNHCE